MNPKTFCIAPWAHACIQPTGDLAPCCVWASPSHHQYSEFDNWINSDELIQTRKNLHQGIKPDSCKVCWKDESIGKKSLRQIYNSEFSKYFDFSKINQDGVVDNTTSTFDFKLGNLCNLKCVMCNGNSSSQLMTEYRQHQEKFSKLNSFQPPDTQSKFDWPLSNEFAEFLARFKSQIRWLKFTGGEPTMIPYVQDILESIPQPELVTVSFATNATKINSQLIDALSKFKAVWITVSLEGIEKHNDQIRFQSSWSSVESNALKLASLPNTYFSVSHVFQCFSVHTLIPLLNWCDQHTLRLQIIPLNTPAYLGINSISAETIEHFKNQLSELTLVHNQHILAQLIELLKTHSYNAELKSQQDQYLTMLDQLRGTQLTSLS